MNQFENPPPENEGRRFWSTAIVGSMWSYLTIYSGKIIVFISLIILARILEKEDFGIAGYAITIMAFLTVVNDFGIRSAIIYFPKSYDSNNQAFWFNVAISVVLSAVVWFGAPLVGLFFEDERAVEVTQAISIILPLLALGNTHDALLQKNMQFNLKAIPDTAKVAVKGLVSIGLALLGYGYWSLILGHIVGTLLWVVCLWWIVAWRPSFNFNFYNFNPIFSYSLKIFAMEILARVATNGDYLLVGRYLGATALGVYTLAFRLPELLIQEIPIVASNVLFPAFTKLKSQIEDVGSNALQAIKYSCLITLPLGIGLVMIAEPLIIVVFSDKWIEATPVMILIAIQMTIVSLTFIFGMVYKAIGRPEILSTIVLVRVLILFPSLWFAASQYGTIVAVAGAHVLISLLSGILEIYIAVKLQNLNLIDVLNAFKPSLVGSLGMIIGVAFVNYQMRDAVPVLQLISAIPTGVLFYLATLYIFQRETVSSIRSQINYSFGKA